MHEFLNHKKHHIMSQVIDVRYTDLELERALCTELLEWADDNQDIYSQVFSHTYLGDYHIAQNHVDEAGFHLMTAKSLAETLSDCDQLLLRIYSLMGIYYDNQADEQNSIQYYLLGLELAEGLDDSHSQGVILNNLAYLFQRHHNYEESLRYYEQAYQVQESLPNSQIKQLILSNLVELSVTMDNLDQARSYIEQCLIPAGESDEEAILYEAKNWCCYYAALGDGEQAKYWADRIFACSEGEQGNRYIAFERSKLLCQSMMKLGEKEYALHFLELMEQNSDDGGLNQLIMLEEIRMKYLLQFEDESKLSEAYFHYYCKSREFERQLNQNIVSVMEANIHLDKLLEQKEELMQKQDDLEQMANRDELTGVYNRRYMERIFSIADSQSGHDPLGIIMLDIDYFKEYNDYYGHIKGDTALKAVAACLQKHKDVRITPCRYGGDEFICICCGLTAKEMEAYIKELRENLYETFIPHEKSLCSDRVTLSIGYSLEKEEMIQPYGLLQLADQALYESKMLGRNCFTRK